MQDTDFLRAILADPDDDAPRLIYADWLEDQGQSARAEFIRLQCTLARQSADHPECSPGQQRLDHLWEVHGRQWQQALHGLILSGVFQRGFLHEVVCDTRTFVQRGEELRSLAPLVVLRLRNARQQLSALANCPSLQGIQSLDLSFNFLGNEGVKRLMACRYLKDLRTLNLSQNSIRSGGVKAIIYNKDLLQIDEIILMDNPLLIADIRRLERHFGRRLVL